MNFDYCKRLQGDPSLHAWTRLSIMQTRQNIMATVLPLSDASRKPRHFPFATTAIILINGFVFFRELMEGDAFVLKWVAVPAHITAGHDWLTILTATFMHASWSHILGNMLFLWAFGPEVEDAMGPLRYIAFYLSGGIISMLAQIAAAPDSAVPNMGASGAIAAVMGAFLITYPRDRIKVLLVIFIFVRVTFIPASLMIVVWFITQLLSVGTIATAQTGGVAYLAHIGGFAFGTLTARQFERSRDYE
jgi:membrane associated rhomboid family serine protease